MGKIINLDTVVSQLSTLLLNAAIKLGHSELQLATSFLSGLKTRFANYVNKLAAGQITLDVVLADLENEKSLIIIEAETLGIVAGSAVQDAINSVIQIFVGEITTITAGQSVYIAGDFSVDKAGTVSSYKTAVGVKTPPTIEQKKIKYGVFFAGDLPTDQIIKVAKAMGVSVVRMGAVTTGYNKNKSKGYLAVKDAGFDVELTVSYRPITQEDGQRLPQPYAVTPGDLQQYSTDLYNLLSDVLPAKVIFENEVMTDMFHSGTAQDYIAQSKVGVGVAKKLGIPTANSGDTRPGIVGAAYLYFKGVGRKEDADYLYNNGMDSRTQKAVKKSWFYDKKLYAKFDEADYLMQNYKYAGLDQVNIHLYEPLIPFARGNDYTSGCLSLICEYANKVSGLPVITNETGVLQFNAKLLTGLMTDWVNSGVKEITFFCSVSANGQTQNLYSFDKNGNVVLNDLGNAFAAFVARN